MRWEKRHWGLLVAVLVFGIAAGFLISGVRVRAPGNESGGSAALTPAPAAPAPPPVATVLQVMQGIVAPASNVIYRSVSTVITAAGTVETAPKTDEDWEIVASSAAALAEGGALLLSGNRARDTADWRRLSQAMIDSAMTALKAAKARDTEGILAAGEVLNASCDNCHQRYPPPDAVPE